MILLRLLLAFTPALAVRNDDLRIVQGADSVIANYPYQLFLKTSRSVCGASIIAPTWALSSASCVDGALPVTVRAGSSSWSSGGTLHNGYAVHVHPQYQPGSNDYNYALIFVYPEFPIGTPGYEAVVVPKFEALPGMILSASGWGSTRYNTTTLSATLKSASYNITTRASCQRFYGSSENITSRILCAKSPQLNTSPCYGDEGGPLVLRQNKEQHGIILFNSRCVTFGQVGFANVADQYDWIYSITGI